MEEHRCKNSGALLFTPGPADKEIINIKNENKDLRKRLSALELLIKKPKKKPRIKKTK